MELEIVVPDECPVMTLPEVAFFPQALLPLHIYEPRYREMLKDVLATNRLFAVAGINEKLASEPQHFEPPHRIASIGIVRACQENADGTSNLLLQGLCRVEIVEILTETPYRQIRLRALASDLGADATQNLQLRNETARLLGLKQKLGGTLAPEVTDFLRGVDDPETFVDLAAFSLCDDVRLKQKLLETLNLQARLGLFNRQLRQDIDRLKLQRKLQGGLADERIVEN